MFLPPKCSMRNALYNMCSYDTVHVCTLTALFLRYGHVLGALDLLRPQVFESEQLLEILQEYFELLSNHTTYHKQYVSLVGKFVDFLCHYVVACSDTALVTKHTKLLLYVLYCSYVWVNARTC